jgi:sugar O-acyltransferase (sialic acid O-acetyltransferase NeuD family)
LPKRRNKVIVVGAGGHARVCADIIESGNTFVLAGFVDFEKPARLAPYLGSPAQWSQILSKHRGARLFIAIGDNFKRLMAVEELKSHSPRYATLIHPKAVVSKTVTIGVGTAIMAGAVVNAGSQIGEHCIINTGSILEHDNQMGDFSSLGPRAVTGGGTRIGEHCAIGLGANLLHSISIGKDTVIGAASLVDGSISEGVVAYGVPARVVRKRKASDPYL